MSDTNHTNAESQKVYNFVDGAKEIIILGPFNILLVFMPLAYICEAYGVSDGVVFAFALLAIAPLAERLGFVTEQLAIHTNNTIGGLLNVTFGNATELIVAVCALQKGYYRVVQLTLLGSILSNLLLVLGCALLAGGLKYFVQSFQTIFAETNMPLLLMACMAAAFPTILKASNDEVSENGRLSVSRCASIVMLSLYILYIFFQVTMNNDKCNELFLNIHL